MNNMLLQRACQLSSLAYLPPRHLNVEQMPARSTDLPRFYDGRRSFVTRNCQAYTWRFDDGDRAEDTSMWVAFRGTSGIEDLVMNVKLKTTRVTLPKHPQYKNVCLHSGYLDEFTSVQGVLERDITDTLKHRHSIRELFFVGHSAGSAMAQVAALYFGSLLYDTDVRIGCVGLGGPKVGSGEDLRHAFDACVDYHIRVVNEGDLVPHLPPALPFADFRHVGPELCLRADGAAGGGGGGAPAGRLRCAVPNVLKSIQDHSLGDYMENIERLAS